MIHYINNVPHQDIRLQKAKRRAVDNYRHQQKIDNRRDLAARALVVIALMFALGTAYLLATLPPCATEDSAMCYWNAQTQGNGHGNNLTNLSLTN